MIKRRRLAFTGLGLVSSLTLALGGSAFAVRPELKDLRMRLQQLANYDEDDRELTSGEVVQALGILKDNTNVCTEGLTAFKNTVHKFVRAKCIACHDQPATGPIQASPAHSVADAEVAYSRIIPLMNFDDLASSRFVTKGGSGHCADYGVPCGVTEPDVLNVVKQWYDGGEKNCPKKGKYFTEAFPLPDNLPTGGRNFARMRFPLGKISPALRGSLFEIEVQRFAAAGDGTNGAVRFRMPRLASPTSPMQIRGVKILINGKFDSFANTYDSISNVIGPQPIPAEEAVPLPHPVLSSDAMIMLNDRPAGDTIQISFEDVSVAAAAPQCKAMDKFQQSPLFAMKARNCFGCHGGGPDNDPGKAPANQRWNMTADDAALCARSLERANRDNPSSSPVLNYPLRGTHGHPRIFINASEGLPEFSGWIDAER